MAFSWNVFAKTVETDVVDVITKAKTDIAVAEKDVAAAMKWIQGNAPTIAADLQSVLGLVEAVGIGSNPEVAAAVGAANLAVNALNAFANASAAGKTSTQAVVSGYLAVKEAQAAAASAAAAAVKSHK